MLNITAIGLYMILASVSGTPATVPATEIPNVQPQVVEEKKTKEVLERSSDVEAYLRTYFADAPILVDVARCESSLQQFDPKTGEPVRGKKNKYDVGAFQINEYYHGATAEKMGINLHTLEGNAQFARYLYEKNGVRDWLPSSKCWSKSTELAMKTDVNIIHQ